MKGGVGKQFFPETAALRQFGKARFHPMAPARCHMRHRAHVLRQQGFELFTPQARQHRRRATAGDGDLQRAAIDDGWKDEAATGLVVHHIDQAVARLCRFKHAVVEGVVIGGGNG